MDWAKENRVLCHQTGDTFWFQGPLPLYVQKPGTLGHLGITSMTCDWGKCARVIVQRSLRVTILWTSREQPLGRKCAWQWKWHFSPVSSPNYSFPFQENRNWGSRGSSLRLSPGRFPALRAAGRVRDVCVYAQSPQAETSKHLVEMQCRRVAKLSSGVVLHSILPTCSFSCMYNCLFIKGFEVLSQW